MEAFRALPSVDRLLGAHASATGLLSGAMTDPPAYARPSRGRS